MDSTEDIYEILSASDYFQKCLEKILSILQASIHCLDIIVKIILDGPDGSGKRLLAMTAAKNLNMNFCEERVADLFDESIVGTEKKIRASIMKVASSTPCLFYLTGYELFTKLEEQDVDRIGHVIKSAIHDLQSNRDYQPIIFVGSTCDFDRIYRSSLCELFHYHITLDSPVYAQAEEIVNQIIKRKELSVDAQDILAKCSNGEYCIGNLFNLIAVAEVEKLTPTTNCSGEQYNDHKKKETTKIDQTKWSDIGGLQNVKKEIIDAIQLSFKFPQLKESGLKRCGILLHGPPGTGKTLIAKAVATECNMSFINVKGPELLNEYVGQSEDNIRKLFRKAHESRPSIIFFDEIDSLAPNRGQTGDSGCLMDRMVSQLLAEMDGAGRRDGVFVIGATNRVDLVDPSLLRPGRFDKVLEVPLPRDSDSRLQILRALTNKISLSNDVDLIKIEHSMRPSMSGADIQGLCSKAVNRTFDRCIKLIELGLKTEDEIEICTNMEDFMLSIEE